MKKQDLFPAVVFLGIAVVYCFPILLHFHSWGQNDWDQFTFWNAVPRETLLRYHQFPLWNPYANGGNVLLAHPQSSFLSPAYLFVIFFGPVFGAKIKIFFYLVAGLWGMFALARHFQLTRSACYFSAFLYMLSSIYALHLTEGQTEWLVIGLVPHFFLYYLKSFEKPRYGFGAVLFLSLILLEGSVYVFCVMSVFVTVYAVLKAIQIRKLIPVKMLSFIFIGTFLLCAVKLLPTLEFIAQYPRMAMGQRFSGTSFAVILRMLLGREQAQWDLLDWDGARGIGLDYEWHEYGAYVGVVPLLFYFAGAVIKFKEHWPLIAAGLVSFLIIMGRNFPIDLWSLLCHLPIYHSLTVPSRHVLAFIFSFALLSAMGFSWLLETVCKRVFHGKIASGRAVGYIVAVLVLVDLLSVNSPIFANTFRVSPLTVARQDVFAQRYHKADLYEKGVNRSSMYPVFLSNSGVLEGYEVMNVTKGAVHTTADQDYKGEVYLSRSQGGADIIYFSPNRIVVDVRAGQPDMLVMNQNYDKGWMVNAGGRRSSATPWQGLVATPVGAGSQKIVFYYLPLSFLLGAFITLTSGCGMVFLYRRNGAQ